MSLNYHVQYMHALHVGIKDRAALHSSRAVLICQVILKAGVTVYVRQVAFMSPNMSLFRSLLDIFNANSARAQFQQ